MKFEDYTFVCVYGENQRLAEDQSSLPRFLAVIFFYHETPFSASLIGMTQLDMIKRSIQTVAPSIPNVHLHNLLHPGYMGGGQLAAMQASVICV